jgi:hypothetical protein
MMREIAQMIGPVHEGDLLRRLDIGHETAVAAEWEIAALYCLARQGVIQMPATRSNTSEADLAYVRARTRERVLVEITAISDSSLHERNPVDCRNLGLTDTERATALTARPRALTEPLPRWNFYGVLILNNH